MKHRLTDTVRTSMTERFNQHGHDTRITADQDSHADTTITIFWCHLCDQSAYVYALSATGWWVEETKLDLQCD